MPRGRRPGRRRKSLSSYFRQVFNEHPQWLWQRSNDDVLNRWSQDHKGKRPSPSVKSNLSNIKSNLRKKDRDEGGGGANKVSRQSAMSEQERALETLEERIDDCLTQAKTLDREGLRNVIKHLRRARNLVVWKAGQDEED